MYSTVDGKDEKERKREREEKIVMITSPYSINIIIDMVVDLA